MIAQNIVVPGENEEKISVWREFYGHFSITDKTTGQVVEFSADLAEEIANAILKSILVNGR